MRWSKTRDSATVQGVILRCGLHRFLVVLAACLLAPLSFGAPNKLIRLRSGVISTPSPAHPSPNNGPRGNGGNRLFIVQFEGSLQPDWQSQLQARGVELLNYVPDDAVVAPLGGDGREGIRSLPFVRWLEPYRTEQKLDRPFVAQVTQGAPRDLEVAALLTTDAAPSELARLRALFRGNPLERQRRFGTIWQGTIPSSQLVNAAGSSAVLWIEPAPRFRLMDESTSALIGGPAANHQTFTQSLGYDGGGVTVAVADSGLHNGTFTNHTELLGRTKAFLFYDPLPNGADENGHGTHVAGIIAGRGITGEGDEFG